MHDQREKSTRQNIPRWYPFEIASRLSETQSLKKPVRFSTSPTELSEKRESWITNPSLFNAIDLASAALAIEPNEDSAVLEASRFLIDSKNSTRFNQELAAKILNTNKPSELVTDIVSQSDAIRMRIFSLKRATILYPNDPINWLDLGHGYTCLGQTEKAEKCIRVAYTLGKHNRYVARSIARFYLHVDDPQRALYVLRSNSNLQKDPWLISAELAIAERYGLKTKLQRIGFGVSDDTNLHSIHLTELRSTLGTIELSHGSERRAKQLLIRSLESANENTLAQIEFLISFEKLSIGYEALRTDLNFEAQARSNFRMGEFAKSFDDANLWLQTQPFALAPIIFASYVASLALPDQSLSIDLLTQALKKDKEKDLVLNNLVVALLLDDRIDEARISLSKIEPNKLNPRGLAVNNATRGLYAIRNKDLNEGRRLYRLATAYFSGRKDSEASLAMALYYWGKEEHRLRSELADSVLTEALRHAANANRQEIVHMIGKLREQAPIK